MGEDGGIFLVPVLNTLRQFVFLGMFVVFGLSSGFWLAILEQNEKLQTRNQKLETRHPAEPALEFGRIDAVLECLDSVYEDDGYVMTVFLFESGIFIYVNLLQNVLV